MSYLGNTGLTRLVELINEKFATAEDLAANNKNTNRTIEFIKTTNAAGNDATIEWTMADNTSATITAMDLRTMIAAIAMRSNQLHVRYRQLKELVETATTYDDVIVNSWNTTVE